MAEEKQAPARTERADQARADKAQEAARENPLEGVKPFGEVQAEGNEDAVKGDPHVHEAIPGAKGIEAIGSGQPVPEAAVEKMDERRLAGIPEPPKVGPIPNVDLYDTPGGYQAVPAGLKPEDVDPAAQTAPRARAAAQARSAAVPESVNKHVAGPGSRTVED